MIAFDLCCDNDHTFEAWFKSRACYEEQLAEAMIECPVCGSKEIRKLLSPTPYQKGLRQPAHRGGEGVDTALAVKTVLSKFYQAIEKNTVDVGSDFAAEALKIHYGAVEPRAIRGTATVEEEDTLRREGVDFIKVPVMNKNQAN